MTEVAPNQHDADDPRARPATAPLGVATPTHAVTGPPGCPSCGAAALPGGRFCEACGATLTPSAVGPAGADPRPGGVGPASAACGSCGGPVDVDGFCAVCGVRQRGPERANPDHDERVLDWVAAVTDRGLHHRLNEDAMAVATVGRTVVGVVCDGVSTTPGSGLAARAGADAAVGVLQRAVESGEDLTAAMTGAVGAAQAAVRAAPAPDPENPPACTLVAAIGGPSGVVVGWLGDSRAYWIDARGGQRLTNDDSWAAELVAAGLLTEGDAEADERAHRITRWLGADAPGGDAHVVAFTAPGPGWLVLCSDGLWNYGSGPEVLARELAAPDGQLPALEAARRLCGFALASGGHDNVTVIVASLGGRDDDDVPV